MKKIISGFTGLITSLIIFSSCSSDNNTTPMPVGAFLVAQISPDAPPLNVTINNNSFDTGMLFGNYTPYLTANPGSYNFSVIASGASVAPLNTTVQIDANKYYSYFIIDSFKSLKSAFINDVFKNPASDSVYYRFLNFCPNLPEPINLIDSTNANFSQNRIFNDQTLNSQFTAFNEIHAGTYNFILKTISGTVLKKQSVVLTGGKVYSLFAKGIYGSTDTAKALSIGLLENYPQR